MLNEPVRHDILILTGEGYTQAEKNAEYLKPVYHEVLKKYKCLPAIFTGRYNDDGDMRIGFSYPVRQDGNRVRVASYVSPDCVKQIITPWSLTHRLLCSEGPILNTMKQIIDAAESTGVKTGLFGATAMQIVTGYEYLHDKSDLDILIEASSLKKLSEFSKALHDIREKTAVNVDAEIYVPDVGYIKLTELMSEQLTVIVRGAFEPKLMKRCLILSSIDNKLKK